MTFNQMATFTTINHQLSQWPEAASYSTANEALAAFKKQKHIQAGKRFSESSGKYANALYGQSGGIDLTGRPWGGQMTETQRVADLWKKTMGLDFSRSVPVAPAAVQSIPHLAAAATAVHLTNFAHQTAALRVPEAPKSSPAPTKSSPAPTKSSPAPTKTLKASRFSTCLKPFAFITRKIQGAIMSMGLFFVFLKKRLY